MYSVPITTKGLNDIPYYGEVYLMQLYVMIII